MTDNETNAHLRFWQESCNFKDFQRWCGTPEPWKEELGALIVELGLKSVLDIGCGTGSMKEVLDNRGYPSDARYLGTEITPKLIKFCELKNIPVVDRDLRDLGNFADEEFDCILCLDVLNHQKEDPRLLLQEMLRVTNKLLIVSFFRDFLAGHDCVNFVHKHDNCIYAEWSRKYLENFLDTLDVTYEWVERKTSDGKHSKPASLFIMKD
jgi:SAM-dependent methyltransferase